MAYAYQNKDAGKRTLESVESTAHEAGHALRDMAEDAGHTVRDFINGKSEKAQEMRKHAEENITKHPLQSVAIAAAVGLVFGALLRR